jgi:hypothetical protein
MRRRACVCQGYPCLHKEKPPDCPSHKDFHPLQVCVVCR